MVLRDALRERSDAALPLARLPRPAGAGGVRAPPRASEVVVGEEMLFDVCLREVRAAEIPAALAARRRALMANWLRPGLDEDDSMHYRRWADAL